MGDVREQLEALLDENRPCRAHAVEMHLSRDEMWMAGPACALPRVRTVSICPGIWPSSRLMTATLSSVFASSTPEMSRSEREFEDKGCRRSLRRTRTDYPCVCDRSPLWKRARQMILQGTAGIAGGIARNRLAMKSCPFVFYQHVEQEGARLVALHCRQRRKACDEAWLPQRLHDDGPALGPSRVPLI